MPAASGKLVLAKWFVQVYSSMTNRRAMQRCDRAIELSSECYTFRTINLPSLGIVAASPREDADALAMAQIVHAEMLRARPLSQRHWRQREGLQHREGQT
jgi:hypothetical protein